jgi:fungal STAND N-terminal Goodbye domain
MGDQSQHSRFQALFESALQNYESQTGTVLADHPLARQLQNCDSVDSVTTVLQARAQAFREFHGDDGKIMKSLNRVVSVLYTLSAGSVLGEATRLVRR